ncbi:MAG: division/cell wall cluster transcriptional repressor MraZ [Phycisphaerae bacterium]
MALFVGEFETTIDSKHRLAINAALRETMVPDEDGEGFVLVLGPDRHLCLYPDKSYRKLLAQMGSSPLPTRSAKKIDLLFATARLLKMDSQGRIVLPEKSMARAVISDRVTLLGQNDHIEIWPTDEWEKHVAESLPGYGDNLFDAGERLSEKNDAQG